MIIKMEPQLINLFYKMPSGTILSVSKLILIQNITNWAEIST